MPRHASIHPTQFELTILKILWQNSPLPVRDIRDRLAELGRDIAHTSVITTLNTMVQKQYLKRKKQGKSFHFSPIVRQEKVSEQMLGDLVQRLFDGSDSAVMLSLFKRDDVDVAELKELRRLINKRLKGEQ